MKARLILEPDCAPTEQRHVLDQLRVEAQRCRQSGFGLQGLGLEGVGLPVGV